MKTEAPANNKITEQKNNLHYIALLLLILLIAGILYKHAIGYRKFPLGPI